MPTFAGAHYYAFLLDCHSPNGRAKSIRIRIVVRNQVVKNIDGANHHRIIPVHYHGRVTEMIKRIVCDEQNVHLAEIGDFDRAAGIAV
jgi:hypothetical protein